MSVGHIRLHGKQIVSKFFMSCKLRIVDRIEQHAMFIAYRVSITCIM